jgi:pimeloyl-ACP methyl ester carboxylesterase
LLGARILCVDVTPVRASTLIVAGGRDRFYERSLFEETAALIPGSRLRISPTRGHITVTWDRRAVADAGAFLDTNP